MKNSFDASINKKLGKISIFSIGSVFILITVIILFTWRTIDKEKQFVSSMLYEKGDTIIELLEKVFYSNTFENVRMQLQYISEEVVSVEKEFIPEEFLEGSKFNFIIITDENGTIVVHSNPEKIGQQLKINGKTYNNEDDFRKIDITRKQRWNLVNIDGEESFVVYKELDRNDRSRSRSRRNFRDANDNYRHNQHMHQEYIAPEDAPYTRVYAFVGQNAKLLESTSQRSMLVVIGIAFSTFFISLILMIVLYYINRNKELQRRHEEAEDLANEMIEKVQELEKDLRQKEKSAAIGDLTAGVAHEIRNPLSSIKGYATFFKQKFEEGSDEEKAAKIMIEEVERLNRAIDDLVGVNSSSDVKLQQADVKEICSKICFLLEPEAQEKNITLDCLINEIPNDKHFITQVDPDRLRQAILNIALNAMEAFENMDKKEKIVTVDLKDDNNFIIISVKDNACGIPEELISRIFDPYFTTKTQGTGLGLVMSKNIIDAHKGRLEIDSCACGTTVEIYLPKNK